MSMQVDSLIISVAGLNINETFRKNVEQIALNNYTIYYAIMTPEPQNQHDPNAIAVHLNTSGGALQIGYVSKRDHDTLRLCIPNMWNIQYYGYIFSSGVGYDNNYYCQIQTSPKYILNT